MLMIRSVSTNRGMRNLPGVVSFIDFGAKMTINELFENWFCLLQLFASVAINLRTGIPIKLQ